MSGRGAVERFFGALLQRVIRGYQLFVSPVIGPHCRHVPTCSEYAGEAIGRFGPWRGGRLAVKRLLRCHPWGTSGLDPVPESLPGRRKGDGKGVADRGNT